MNVFRRHREMHLPRTIAPLYKHNWIWSNVNGNGTECSETSKNIQSVSSNGSGKEQSVFNDTLT